MGIGRREFVAGVTSALTAGCIGYEPDHNFAEPANEEEDYSTKDTDRYEEEFLECMSEDSLEALGNKVEAGGNKYEIRSIGAYNERLAIRTPDFPEGQKHASISGEDYDVAKTDKIDENDYLVTLTHKTC